MAASGRDPLAALVERAERARDEGDQLVHGAELAAIAPVHMLDAPPNPSPAEVGAGLQLDEEAPLRCHARSLLSPCISAREGPSDRRPLIPFVLSVRTGGGGPGTVRLRWNLGK